MSQSLITIGTYWDVTEARLARIYLEAAGIRSRPITNEAQSSQHDGNSCSISRSKGYQISESRSS